MNLQDANHIKEIQRDYLEFLDDEHQGGKYHARTKRMIQDKHKRLYININDLRKQNPARVKGLLYNSLQELEILKKAVKEYVGALNPPYARSVDDFFVSLEGSFGNNYVTPRSLSSKHLEHMVCVEGIVTKCSLANLRMVRTVHFCPANGKFLERKYADFTSTDSFPTATVYPTKDDDGNLLETEFGLSAFKDEQTFTIQEMPERAPAGQLPRYVDVLCDNDLVDSCKPGDRVRVIGVYRCKPGKHGSFTNAIFRTFIIANNITPLTSETHLGITRDDMLVFKKIAKRKDVFELFTRSIAPSIHGHEYVKKAILCLLVGGVERILANDSRIRGDVNVLLIGDPGVAKSQLLRFVLQTAPTAVPTTGRGSTGVGLTASVTVDPETNERRLEAGAMVLADRGIVCIDEFDKMSDADRTTIHEVMEQGRVTIAKAGIQTRLNARCAVLAAANPVYGKYDPYKTPMENIGLQDSLLSRFDLLFVLLDIPDTEDDNRIADHVVRMHRYRNPTEEDGEVLPVGSCDETMQVREENSPEDNNIYEDYNSLLHGASLTRDEQILNMNFIKKYVHMSKNVTPSLSQEASRLIIEEYAKLRSQDSLNLGVARTQPITVRTLETLIRLSSARARLRFSRTINADDARMAIELVQYAIFKKVYSKKDHKKRSRHGGGEEAETDEEEEEGDGNQKAKRQRSNQLDIFEMMLSQDEPPPSLSEMREHSKQSREKTGEATTATTTVTVSEERLKIFKDIVFNVFLNFGEESLPLDKFTEALCAKAEDFSSAEIRTCVEILSDRNNIMIADNTVFLI